MIVWRFSQHESLEGRGGLFASARWHTRGREILYCAPNPATAMLEVLVHADIKAPRALLRNLFIKMEIPDEVPREAVEESVLPPDWSRRPSVTRAWGDRWLRQGSSAVLLVRSVLVPETYNILVNPRHATAELIQRTAVFPYLIDSRLVHRD